MEVLYKKKVQLTKDELLNTQGARTDFFNFRIKLIDGSELST